MSVADHDGEVPAVSSIDQRTRASALRTQSVRGLCDGPPSRAARRSRTRKSRCAVHRYYDPTTDQFLTVDPVLAKTGQPYAFAGNNPLNASDPLGLFCWGWCSFSNIATNVSNWTSDAVGWTMSGISGIVSAIGAAVSAAAAVTSYLEAMAKQAVIDEYLGAMAAAHEAAHVASNAVTEVSSHYTGLLQIAGGVASAAALATGVGALADVAIIGSIETTSAFSVGAGLGAAASDIPGCVKGSGRACAGMVLGLAGGGIGFAGNLMEAGNGAIAASGAEIPIGRAIASGLLNSTGFGLGAGAATWDTFRN